MDPLAYIAIGGGLVLLGGALVAGSGYAGWTARGPAVRLAEGERDLANARADAAELELAAEIKRKRRNRDQDHEDISWVLDLDSPGSDSGRWRRVLSEADTGRAPLPDGSSVGPAPGDEGGPDPLAAGGPGAVSSGNREAGPGATEVAQPGRGEVSHG